MCDLLQFRFPLDSKNNESLFNEVNAEEVWKLRNHKGALEFPEEMKKYLEKEYLIKSVVGPFNKNSFLSGIKISPLNSLPKNDTNERRVIFYLNFPKDKSVNDFISKEEYLGEQMETDYPKIDDFILIITQKGIVQKRFKKGIQADSNLSIKL